MESNDEETTIESTRCPQFNFPFQPYDIQVKFMKALFCVLQDGNIGIFESPTGTVSWKYQIQK